jgi:hypothetical protein
MINASLTAIRRGNRFETIRRGAGSAMPVNRSTRDLVWSLTAAAGGACPWANSPQSRI